MGRVHVKMAPNKVARFPHRGQPVSRVPLVDCPTITTAEAEPRRNRGVAVPWIGVAVVRRRVERRTRIHRLGDVVQRDAEGIAASATDVLKAPVPSLKLWHAVEGLRGNESFLSVFPRLSRARLGKWSVASIEWCKQNRSVRR